MTAAIVLLAALTLMLLNTGLEDASDVEVASDRVRALYRAEASLSETRGLLSAAVVTGEDAPLQVGSPEDPRRLPSGTFWVAITPSPNGSYIALSRGLAGNITRGIEAVLVSDSAGIYASGLFAGNSSGDPDYALRISGNGLQADQVNGDIFSGGDVVVVGDATVAGTVRARGRIMGTEGEEGLRAALPDIAGADHATRHDVDVAAIFAERGYTDTNALGGEAEQVPEDDPAHIFRKNPSNRTTETSGTVGDDYFLEDPYEPVQQDLAQDGTDATKITLSGAGGKPGPAGSDLVYFIDGNLWIHNKATFSFRFHDEGGEAVRATIVVRGNIHVSDILFYGNEVVDGIALIAIVAPDDPMGVTSGNIVFGDPAVGTLRQMSGFLYAENDFYDMNVAADGSAEVLLNGNMTAGNHVSIQRDYGDQHSRLLVDFDERVRDGNLELPGLPNWRVNVQGYRVASWREVNLEFATQGQ